MRLYDRISRNIKKRNMFRIGKPSITNIEYIKPYICHDAFGFHSTSNDGGINEDLFSGHCWFQIVRLNITICVHKQFHKNPQSDLEVLILKVWSTVYYDILRSFYVHHYHVGWSRVCRFLHLYLHAVHLLSDYYIQYTTSKLRKKIICLWRYNRYILIKIFQVIRTKH